MYFVPVAAIDDLGESALAWLLAPVTVQTFLDEIWGTGLHHIGRGARGYFDTLLAEQTAAEQLLAALRTEPSAVRLVRGADHGDPADYQLADGTLDLARIRAALDSGYTIICNNIERFVRAMTSLTHSVEVELNFPTHVNAYITPPGSTGFLPHYDHHDVLVLQVQGSKTWYFYGEDPVPPHLMQQLHEVDSADLPAPSSLQLASGDTLYLPRGQVHSAETTSALSVHLTVGIHVPTVLTLLTHALHLLSLRDDRIHTRLPARHLDDPQLRVDLDALMHQAVAAVTSPESITEGLGAMQDLLVRRGRCPVVGQVSDTVGIDGETLVRKCQPLYSRVIDTDHGVGLQFAQLLVRAGPDHEAAMRFLSACRQPFRVGDLPGLTAAQQTELARSLIMSGFLIRLPADGQVANP